MVIRTLDDARAIAGSLSEPGKMPGHAYSIPAELCKRGAKLAQFPNSICSQCYALKHRYVWDQTQQAMWGRYLSLDHPQWVEAMVFMIRHVGDEYFRWHDSGDLQSPAHLEKIQEIAEAIPKTQFWLPTRELKILKTVQPTAQNLVIRYSDVHIGDYRPRKDWLLKSGVSPKALKSEWAERVATNTNEFWHCPAPLQGNSCGNCRACWNPEVEYVTYLEH